MYYLYSENKGADELCGGCTFVFAYAKVAHIVVTEVYSLLLFCPQVWSTYEEPKEEEVVEEAVERVISYRNIVITEVQDDLKFYAQTVENGGCYCIDIYSF